jgi:uncharacterized protein YcbK (DUF882 family)
MKGNTTCPDHCGLAFDDDFIVRLIAIDCLMRTTTGKEITILSGPRCAAHNTKVRGVNGSSHILGIAADIEFLDNFQCFWLLNHIIGQGFVRIGMNRAEKFIHIDSGTEKMNYPQGIIWNY